MAEIINTILGGDSLPDEFTFENVSFSDSFSYAVGTTHDYDLSGCGTVILCQLYYTWRNDNPNYNFGPVMKWQAVYEDDSVDDLVESEDWVAGANSTHTTNINLYDKTNHPNKNIKALRGTRTGTHVGTNAAATFNLQAGGQFRIGIIKIHD